MHEWAADEDELQHGFRNSICGGNVDNFDHGQLVGAGGATLVAPQSVAAAGGRSRLTCGIASWRFRDAFRPAHATACLRILLCRCGSGDHAGCLRRWRWWWWWWRRDTGDAGWHLHGDVDWHGWVDDAYDYGAAYRDALTGLARATRARTQRRRQIRKTQGQTWPPPRRTGPYGGALGYCELLRQT